MNKDPSAGRLPGSVGRYSETERLDLESMGDIDRIPDSLRVVPNQDLISKTGYPFLKPLRLFFYITVSDKIYKGPGVL